MRISAPLDELLDDLLALFGLEVERYGALAGVEEEEEAALLKARLIVVEGADAARGIAPARPLDLDDICAVITQDSRGVWPRGVVRHINDADTLKRHEHCVTAPLRRSFSGAGLLFIPIVPIDAILWHCAGVG